jgi:hypothetical protein
VFGRASLPDTRLGRRLVQTAASLAASPGESLNRACENWAESKGGYRFLANERVTSEMLSEPVFEEGCELCEGQQYVFAVQDTTYLNYSHHPSVEGLGPLNDETMQGLVMHNTMSVRADGQPLGLLDMQVWAREKTEPKTRRERRSLPMEEKESRKWFFAARAAHERVMVMYPDGERPRLIFVADREADDHDLIEEIRKLQEGFILRVARRNRLVAGEPRTLGEALAAERVGRRMEVEVPRRGNRRARTAQVELRWRQFTLTPGKSAPAGRTPQKVWAVWVYEPNPPNERQRLDWMLLSSEPVENVEDAGWVVTAYTYRWRVEDFHRVLKSGCRIEAHQFKSEDRIEKLIFLFAAIAMRILRLTHLARTEPEAPCTTVLSDLEWRTLWTCIHKTKPRASQKPPPLRMAVLWIGRLGGHLGRRRDGMPGVKTLWLGWRDLCLLTAYEHVRSSIE